MGVRVVRKQGADRCPDTDYVRVSTHSDPNDDTRTLATIQRIVDKSDGALESDRNWRVKTLVLDTPMSANEAVGLATRYAERKGIPVVYTD